MSDLCRLIWCAVIGLFRSQAVLQAEIVLLRHQLNVLRRRSPKRVNFSNITSSAIAHPPTPSKGVIDPVLRPPV